MKLLLATTAAYILITGCVGEAGWMVPRIYLGSDASAGQFPYAALLEAQISATVSGFCGGSIISTNWVLTAAHCINSIQYVTVFGGLLNAKERSMAQKRVTNGSLCVVHPNYTNVYFANDIGLIPISPPFQKTVNLTSVNLPPPVPGTTYDNTNGVVAGWGITNDAEGWEHPQLQWATLLITPMKVCLASLASTNIYLCTSKNNVTGGTCGGDSGSGLTQQNSKGNAVVGIVSWTTSGTCVSSKPNFLTYVGSYLSWIQQVTGLTPP